jgi:hypothetical protein
MRYFSLFGVLAFSLLCPGSSAIPAVFGRTDDRQDLYEVPTGTPNGERIHSNASAVAGLVARAPQQQPNGLFKIRSDPQASHQWPQRPDLRSGYVQMRNLYSSNMSHIALLFSSRRG